jgi:hypothetical protein
LADYAECGFGLALANPKALLACSRPDLAAEAQSSPDVALIDLHRLYHGA